MFFEYADYVKNSNKYEKVLSDIKKEINTFLQNFHDDTRFLSGWGHNYFCDDDGGKLIFDITKPKEHICSVCGKKYVDFKYDCCHITIVRNNAIVTALKAALIFNITRDNDYKKISLDIIDFYAKNYDSFATHAKDKITDNTSLDVGGAGKIMPQGLNEAIITIRMISALELMKDSLEQQYLLDLKTSIFDKVYLLLYKQKNHIHNIPCWINSAIGVMGLFFDDKRFIDEAFKNAFNINEQIEKGVTESGFWYEGSIHYNFFTLEGIVSLLVFAKTYNYQVNEKSSSTILKMLESAYKYSFDNDIFPNPGDGWPNVSLKTYAHTYYMARKVFGQKIDKYLNHIENNKMKRQTVPLSETYYYNNEIPIERLLFFPMVGEEERELPIERQSISFEGSNCLMLREDNFNVFMKYGHQIKSHAHPDKMNVEIVLGNDFISRDLSNAGYGSTHCNEWHRKIISHNTCIINANESDIENIGKLVLFEKNHCIATCKPYENVVYRRDISIKDCKLNDEFTVTCKVESRIDWVFHFEDMFDLENIKCSKSEEFSEYKYFSDVVLLDKSTEIKLVNKLIAVNLIVEKNANVYIMKSMGNPSTKIRNTIIISKYDKEAIFKMSIEKC